ncbi:unnamed protein product [Lactuca saligna]|uniref:Xyloglucan endotransglucosylase/hydrolase n=1 Tax=Lactuca saligna TaxID=75948 RepID=A0AA35Y119_LACSI|nr:unnamed protein product [Lactuca saligna]
MDLHLWIITKMMVILSEVIFLLRVSDATQNARFDENYKIIWGNQHVQLLNQRQEVQLTLDKSSGAGFGSKLYFGSGCFQMKIKLPARDSGGIVTAFYLFLNTTVHEEMDFEFLGNRPDFHYYKLLWNDHQVVFFVDDTPIRVYKNNIIRGVGYPNHTLQVITSFWDGSSWATDGGKTKVNYSNAPFHVNFQDFNIDGCISMPNSPNKDCASQKYWWNNKKYWQLNPQQLKSLENVRKKYMTYDYCTDKSRYPTPRPECS